MANNGPYVEHPDSDEPASSASQRMQMQQQREGQGQGQSMGKSVCGQLVPANHNRVDIRALMTRSMKLRSWFPMVIGSDSSDICICGILQSNELHTTASLVFVHASRFLLTNASAAYFLDGPIDARSAAELGFHEGFISAFANGFPSDWEVHFRLARRMIYGQLGDGMLQAEGERLEAGRDANKEQQTQHNPFYSQHTDVPPVPDVHFQQPIHPNKTKLNKQKPLPQVAERKEVRDEEIETSFDLRRKRKPQLDFEADTTAFSDESFHVTAAKGDKRQGQNKETKEKGQYTAPPYKKKAASANNNKKETIKQVVHQTRSGRLVHPPLAGWANERVVRDADGNMLRVDTPTTNTIHTNGRDPTKAKEIARAAGLPSPKATQSKERADRRPMAAAEKPGARQYVKPKIVSYSSSSDYSESDGEQQHQRLAKAHDFETPIFQPKGKRAKCRRIDSDSEGRLTRSMLRERKAAEKRCLEMEWAEEDERMVSKEWSGSLAETPLHVPRKKKTTQRRPAPKIKLPVKKETKKSAPKKSAAAKSSRTKNKSSPTDLSDENDESDGEDESEDEELEQTETNESGDGGEGRHAEVHTPQTHNTLPKNLTNKELGQLKLAILSYKIVGDESWVLIAKALNNVREPHEYKKAAIARLNWKEPRKAESTADSTVRVGQPYGTPITLRTEVTNKVGTLAFQNQADRAARERMFGLGNNTTLGGAFNLTSAANGTRAVAEEREENLYIPSDDDSLLEALQTPPAEAVARKATKSRKRQTFEPSPIEDSPVSSCTDTFNLAPLASPERNRRQRFARNLVKSKFAASGPGSNTSRNTHPDNSQKAASKKMFASALSRLEAARKKAGKLAEKENEEEEQDSLDELVLDNSADLSI